ADAKAFLSQARRVGKELDLAFTDLNGRAVSLQDYRGKVVMIDFWAMWCGPCIRSLPHLKELHQEFSGKGFEVLGINFDGEPEKLAAFIKKEGMSWPQYPGGEP